LELFVESVTVSLSDLNMTQYKSEVEKPQRHKSFEVNRLAW
jgi:hypothetical protein